MSPLPYRAFYAGPVRWVRSLQQHPALQQRVLSHIRPSSVLLHMPACGRPPRRLPPGGTCCTCCASEHALPLSNIGCLEQAVVSAWRRGQAISRLLAQRRRQQRMLRCSMPLVCSWLPSVRTLELYSSGWTLGRSKHKSSVHTLRLGRLRDTRPACGARCRPDQRPAPWPPLYHSSPWRGLVCRCASSCCKRCSAP